MTPCWTDVLLGLRARQRRMFSTCLMQSWDSTDSMETIHGSRSSGSRSCSSQDRLRTKSRGRRKWTGLLLWRGPNRNVASSHDRCLDRARGWLFRWPRTGVRRMDEIYLQYCPRAQTSQNVDFSAAGTFSRKGRMRTESSVKPLTGPMP